MPSDCKWRENDGGRERSGEVQRKQFWCMEVQSRNPQRDSRGTNSSFRFSYVDRSFGRHSRIHRLIIVHSSFIVRFQFYPYGSMYFSFRGFIAICHSDGLYCCQGTSKVWSYLSSIYAWNWWVLSYWNTYLLLYQEYVHKQDCDTFFLCKQSFSYQ